MTDASPATDNKKTTFRFIARIENGVIVPQETVALPGDQVYLVTIELEPVSEIEPEGEVDALAQLSSLAQPLGPADLARNFSTYTHRVVLDESTS